MDKNNSANLIRFDRPFDRLEASRKTEYGKLQFTDSDMNSREKRRERRMKSDFYFGIARVEVCQSKQQHSRVR